MCFLLSAPCPITSATTSNGSKLERQQALCGSGEQKTLLNHLSINSFLIYAFYLSPYFFPALLASGRLCYYHQ